MLENILIIEPSTSGLDLLRTAHRMGCIVFVFSANQDERIIPETYLKYIDELIVVDTNSFQSLSRALHKLHNSHPLSAIIPGFEIFVSHAARLAALINLPGISLETCECFRNKFKLRDILSKNGIKTPRYFQIISEADLDNAAAFVEFPCIIKPIDQSGSMHVSRVDDIYEMKNAYNKMCIDTWTEMGKGIGTVALVEEYISGSEYSIEGFVDSKGPQILAITEKLVEGYPYFVEMGHIVEPPINSRLRKKIQCYIETIITILQMNVGVFHAEIKLENNEPKLIEIAGRLAGDKICDLILLALGVNLYQIMIEVHLGQVIDLNINSNKYAGIRYFAPSEDMNSYIKINNIDKISMLPGFRDFKILINSGQPVPLLQNFTGRAAYTIFTASTYEDLKYNLDKAESLISFS